MTNFLPTTAWVLLTVISGFLSIILFGLSHDLESKNMLITAWITLIIFITSFICIWHSPSCIQRYDINEEYLQQCVKSEIRIYIKNLPKSVIYDILNENKN
jgi:multisubunit Na+/H+ antiporter MnhE subunit